MPETSFRFPAALRALFGWAGRLLLVLYFCAAGLFLAGRYWILPDIDQHRSKVEQALSQAIGLQVRIATLSAQWPGLHPSLSIEGLQLFDKAGQPALAFDRVEAEIGWSSLWHLGLRLHRLQIVSPVLDIRRDARGTLHVAGLPIQGDSEGDSGFADWLLAQGRIVISDARIRWRDELRDAPPLELQKLNFELRNAGRRHSFGLTAAPSAAVARSLDVRGFLNGRNPADPTGWHGELYADLDDADLSAWTPWLDLPLRWSRGLGGLRLWLNFSELQPTSITADLQLADVSLRLRDNLPDLNLSRLEGRLIARRNESGFTGEIRHLALSAAGGIEMPATDARLTLRTQTGQESGEFRTNGLDIGVLAALAGYLPLPEDVHARLQAFRPKGRLSDLELSWQGPPEALRRWQAKGDFAGLSLAPYRELPGFGGISGHLKGNERAGEIVLDSHNAEILLPAVFPEPRLALAQLAAEVGWQAHEGQMDLLLRRMNFSNHDANGEANGRYRYTGEGPGEIDLTASLTHAAGNAVWRYMPLVVNKDARDWLQASIIGGRADSATLRLKGDLNDFPYADGKKGIFQVKGSFRGATLKYAPSWPEITQIDGDLLFEGVRMQIRAQRGKILGTDLSEVVAEISDLEQAEEILRVKGKARGETQRFLDFIEASPVGERIDHFTQPMSASGSGDLDLKLVLPLRHLDNSDVQGRFRLAAGNQLRVLPALPVLTDAQGEFTFTSDRLQAKGLRARIFGMPAAFEVRSLPGGTVRVEGNGKLLPATLRRQPESDGWAVLDHLSGESSWRGSVTVKKPGAEIIIESGLDGLSSSLPEPFNKSATDRMPLRVEGRIDPKRDQWRASLGSTATMHINEANNLWRGRLSLGNQAVRAAGAMPAQGLALDVALPQLDLDAWSGLLGGNRRPTRHGEMPGFALSAISVKLGSAQLLDRTLHDLQLQATYGDSRWRIGIESREANGQLTWEEGGAGRISGRLSRLFIPAADGPDSIAPADKGDTPQELPAIDLVIDDLKLRDMALGESRIKAENLEGGWRAKLDIKNDVARLTGEGRWRPSRIAPETRLRFNLDVSDTEKLLARLGMPDAVRQGMARIDGDVSWAGTPFGLDWPSLSGKLKLDAEKGQFKKLEPGVGRLLGVLSLQSLPRRITLDFRDIFSEGFAFDSIHGEGQLARGMMKTQDFMIRGPAAKVLISGQANLVNETQDLNVRVQPAIGESIAVGAMIAHPVAGAVAWAAQKILNDPLDRAFAYEYAVTGHWADPKVEKLSGPARETQKATP